MPKKIDGQKYYTIKELYNMDDNRAYNCAIDSEAEASLNMSFSEDADIDIDNWEKTCVVLGLADETYDQHTARCLARQPGYKPGKKDDFEFYIRASVSDDYRDGAQMFNRCSIDLVELQNHIISNKNDVKKEWPTDKDRHGIALKLYNAAKWFRTNTWRMQKYGGYGANMWIGNKHWHNWEKGAMCVDDIEFEYGDENDEHGWENKFKEFAEAFAEDVLEVCQDICDEVVQDIRETRRWLTSEKKIVQDLTDQGALFTEDGERDYDAEQYVEAERRAKEMTK